MQPITDPYKGTCSQIISSSCVKWATDLKLSYITFSKGQSLTEVIVSLSVALTDIKNALDVSNIDLQCLEDCSCILACSDDPPLADVIECIIKDHCELKTKVDGIIIPEIELVDYSCAQIWSLTTINSDKPLNTIIQLICEVYNRTKNDGINSQITDITNRLTVLENTTGGDTTTTLINPGCATVWSVATTPENAITLLSNRVKALEELILNNSRGSDITNCTPPTIDLDVTETTCLSTIATQLDTWGYDDTIFDNYTTLEDKFKALLKLNCSLVDRMSSIYDNINTCCGKDCSDYELLLNVSRGINTTSFTLLWNNSIGIPNFGTAAYPQVYECSGAPKLNLTDKNGKKITIFLGFMDYQYTINFTDTTLTTTYGLDLTGDLIVSLEICYSILNEDGTTFNCSKTVNTVAKLSEVTDPGCYKVVYSYIGNPFYIQGFDDNLFLNAGGGYEIPTSLTTLATGFYISNTVDTTCDGQLYTANGALVTLYNNLSLEVSNIAYISAKVTNGSDVILTIVLENQTGTVPVEFTNFYGSPITVISQPITCPDCI